MRASETERHRAFFRDFGEHGRHNLLLLTTQAVIVVSVLVIVILSLIIFLGLLDPGLFLIGHHVVKQPLTAPLLFNTLRGTGLIVLETLHRLLLLPGSVRPLYWLLFYDRLLVNVPGSLDSTSIIKGTTKKYLVAFAVKLTKSRACATHTLRWTGCLGRIEENSVELLVLTT